MEKKYLKYKIKYLHLKKLFGGSIETAKTLFNSRIRKDNNIHNIFNNDPYLKSNIGIQMIDRETLSIQSSDILQRIFNFIVNTTNDNKIIDFVCKIYLNGKMGIPNSIENVGRLKDNVIKFNILKNNHKTEQKLEDFESLGQLEKFISDKSNELEAIEEKRIKKNKQRQEQIDLKEKGKNDVIIQLETNNVIIYTPTTENGSKYYGRNTKWCTAAKNNNMFEFYNNFAPLYIIQSKTNPLDKYQLQFAPDYGIAFQQGDSIMDNNDEIVSIKDIKSLFNDDILSNWIDDKVLHNVKQRIKTNTLNIDYIHIIESHTIQLIKEKVDIYKHIGSILKNKITNEGKINTSVDLCKFLITLKSFDFVDIAKSIKSITFNYGYEPTSNDIGIVRHSHIPTCQLEDLLHNMLNLEELSFGLEFNQPLGNSLNGLTNLKKLSFGDKFDQPLENSLNDLVNLEELSFGYKFNQPIGNSLNHLTKLKKLKFGQSFSHSTSDINLPNLPKIDHDTIVFDEISF